MIVSKSSKIIFLDSFVGQKIVKKSCGDPIFLDLLFSTSSRHFPMSIHYLFTATKSISIAVIWGRCYRSSELTLEYVAEVTLSQVLHILYAVKWILGDIIRIKETHDL